MLSFKEQSGSTRESSVNDKILKLTLNPETATSYNYKITNESKTNIEVNDKETALIKRYYSEIKYNINRDSAENLFASSGILTNKAKWFFGQMALIAWWELQHVKGFKHVDTKFFYNETDTGSLQ